MEYNFISTITVLFSMFVTQTTCHSDFPSLLLISFDGFRWDYLIKAKKANKLTPNFDYFIANGVFVDNGVKNVYITKTFPNHFSIVTGLYEESHGLVANEFYDPVKMEEISIFAHTKEAYWFDNGTDEYNGYPEPIWLTNEKASGHYKRHSGIVFWPGSEAKGMTVDPDRFFYYDKAKNMSFTERIDIAIGWFLTEEKPINLGLIYFNEPDHTGHRVGPDAQEMMELIEELDGVVGYLLTKLRQSNLISKLNVIITSDHGMQYFDKVIELDSCVDGSLYRNFGNGPVMNILPNPGKSNVI